jgi:hypothetical protein
MTVLVAAALVLGSLSIANYVAWLRLKPEVPAIGWIADRPDYESHLVNIHQRAALRAKGTPDSFLPIYDVRNPGFFLLVAELYVRAGATTPVPLELTSILLFNLGTLLFCLWVYLLFADMVVAAFSTAFLALSQFLLFFPGVTHTMPFEFFFFNATLFFFLLFLRKKKTAYLAASLVAMFLTCMNYWFYYMSSWIIMVGLWWQFRGRPHLKEIAIISTPPVAAAALTAIMVMALSGGMQAGAMRLVDILAARTFDARIPGGQWLPDTRFLTGQDWRNYPWLVKYRLEGTYSIDLRWFSIAAGCTAILLWFRNRSALVSALILLLGGLSWYYVMFQHTHIHHFTGQYSFMAICPIFGLIVSETIASLCAAGRSAAPLARRTLELIGSGRGAGYAASSPVSREAARPVGRLAVAAVMLFVGFKMAYPYAANTLSVLRETVRASRTVEAKYREAIASICQRRGTVTLADLQSASKDWGFEWRPSIIADTNQLPKCSE